MIDKTRVKIEQLSTKTRLPLKHMIKFGIVGSTGVLINMGFFALFNELFKWFYQVSSIIAIEISILFNFFLNSCWTWRDRNTQCSREKKVRFFKYHLISGIAAIINYITLIGVVELLEWNKYLANLCGIGLAVGVNFVVNHKWNFKK